MMASQKLTTSLGLRTAVSLVVGGIIGSGIFMKPSVMAAQLGSPTLLLAVWIIAGIITLFGALSNAEIASMLPETGGQFVFFKVMYGDFVAFLYGWAAFIVFNTAGIASIAYVMGSYVEYFVALPRFTEAIETSFVINIPFLGKIFPLQNAGVKSITLIVIMMLTWLNYRSTRLGGNVQVIFTILKVTAIMLLIVGVMATKPSVTHIAADSQLNNPTGWAMVGAIVAALSGAFWGYDGWNNITFVAGEIRDPQRNIPRALLIGLLICIAIYGLVVLSYIAVLPIDHIASAPLVASDAASVLLGPVAGAAIAALVIFSTFGTTNGNILATARVTFAMGQNKQFFTSAGNVHPRFGTPGNALWMQGLWTSILVISGSFDMLTDMLVFVSWLFYGLSAVGIFILRYKMPDKERPYRVWGYPFVPAIFVLFTGFFLVATVVNDVIAFSAGRVPVINSLLGLALTLTGVPLYFYFRTRNRE